MVFLVSIDSDVTIVLSVFDILQINTLDVLDANAFGLGFLFRHFASIVQNNTAQRLCMSKPLRHFYESFFNMMHPASASRLGRCVKHCYGAHLRRIIPCSNALQVSPEARGRAPWGALATDPCSYHVFCLNCVQPRQRICRGCGQIHTAEHLRQRSERCHPKIPENLQCTQNPS